MDDDSFYIKCISGSVDQLRLIFPQRTQENINKLLCLAVSHQKIDIVKHLLQEGANPNAFNQRKMEDIIKTALYGCIDIVKLLFDAGAWMNKRLLCHAGNVEVLKYMIDNYINMLPDNIYTYCLMDFIDTPCDIQNMDIINYLVDNGANIHMSNDKLLILATTYGQFHIVQKFFNGYTPDSTLIQRAFGCAISVSNLCIVKYLHEHGAQVNKHV